MSAGIATSPSQLSSPNMNQGPSMGNNPLNNINMNEEGRLRSESMGSSSNGGGAGATVMTASTTAANTPSTVNTATMLGSSMAGSNMNGNGNAGGGGMMGMSSLGTGAAPGGGGGVAGGSGVSDLKLKRFLEHNQRLREQLEMRRISASEASQSLIQFVTTTKDALLPSLWGNPSSDPFAKPSKGCCTIC